jgi:4-methyl-5(b-hydroxyethyl)-thiazole monophosphate biosynthesis
MKKAVLFLAGGFEETEAVGTADVLRRGDIDTKIVSVTESLEVVGAHGIAVVADGLLSATDCGDADALVLPGGMPGASNLNACEALRRLLVRHHGEGRLVAAICAAPLVPGGLGLLRGRRATCYPGFEPQLAGAILTGEAVVVDGHLITGAGPGFVLDFALAVVEWLQSKKVADRVAGDLLLSR